MIWEEWVRDQCPRGLRASLKHQYSQTPTSAWAVLAWEAPLQLRTQVSEADLVTRREMHFIQALLLSAECNCTLISHVTGHNHILRRVLTWLRRLYLTLALGGRVLALAEYQLARGPSLARPAVGSQQCRIGKKLLIEFKVVTNTNRPGRTVPGRKLRENTFAFLPSGIKFIVFSKSLKEFFQRLPESHRNLAWLNLCDL